MNRTERRATARKDRRCLRASRHEKRSHCLPPQVCMLYVPDAGGYVADFSPKGFRVVESPGLAKLYIEDDATSAARTFREITGLRVAVRPYYCPHVERIVEPI